MKNKTMEYSGKKSFKLFLGIFASVVSIFALVYLVQNPLFVKDSEAASNPFPVTLTLNLQKNTSGKCNSAITSYNVTMKYVDKTSGSVFAALSKQLSTFSANGKTVSFKAYGPSSMATVYAQVISQRLNGNPYRASSQIVKTIVKNSAPNYTILVDCR